MLTLGSILILLTQFIALIGAAFTIYQAAKVKQQVGEIKVSIDGRLEQLLKVSGAMAHAEGKVEGIAEQKAEGVAVATTGTLAKEVASAVVEKVVSKIVDGSKGK